MKSSKHPAPGLADICCRTGGEREAGEDNGDFGELRSPCSSVHVKNVSAPLKSVHPLEWLCCLERPVLMIQVQFKRNIFFKKSWLWGEERSSVIKNKT